MLAGGQATVEPAVLPADAAHVIPTIYLPQLAVVPAVGGYRTFIVTSSLWTCRSCHHPHTLARWSWSSSWGRTETGTYEQHCQESAGLPGYWVLH